MFAVAETTSIYFSNILFAIFLDKFINLHFNHFDLDFRHHHFFLRWLCFSFPCFHFFEFTLFQVNLLKIFIISIIIFHPKHKIKYYFRKTKTTRAHFRCFFLLFVIVKSWYYCAVERFSPSLYKFSFISSILIKFFLCGVTDLIPNWFMFLCFCFFATGKLIG